MADTIASKYVVLKEIENVEGILTGVSLVKNVKSKKKFICKKISKESTELKILKQLTGLPGIIKICDHYEEMDSPEQTQVLPKKTKGTPQKKLLSKVSSQKTQTSKGSAPKTRPFKGGAQEKQTSKSSAQEKKPSKISTQKGRQSKGSARGKRHSHSEDDEPPSNPTFANYCNLDSLWQVITPLTDVFLVCQPGHDRHDQIEGSKQAEGDETDDSDTEDSDAEDNDTDDKNTEASEQTKVDDQTKCIAQTEGGGPTEDSDQAEAGAVEEECSTMHYDESAYDLIFYEYCELGDLEGIKQRHEGSSNRIPESFLWHVLSSMAEALRACHTVGGNPDAKPIAHKNVQPGHILFSSIGASNSGFPRVVLTGFRESYHTPSITQLRSDFTKLGKTLWQLCLVADQRRKENEEKQDLANFDEDLFKLLSGEYESSDVFGYSVELQTIVGELVNEMMFPKIDGKYVQNRIEKLKAAAKMCEHGGKVILEDEKADD